MSDICVWKKYKKIQKIGESSFECVYKGKNKEKGNIYTKPIFALLYDLKFCSRI